MNLLKTREIVFLKIRDCFEDLGFLGKRWRDRRLLRCGAEGGLGRGRIAVFVAIWSLCGGNASGSLFPWLPGANCRRSQPALQAEDGQPVERTGF